MLVAFALLQAHSNPITPNSAPHNEKRKTENRKRKKEPADLCRLFFIYEKPYYLKRRLPWRAGPAAASAADFLAIERFRMAYATGAAQKSEQNVPTITP